MPGVLRVIVSETKELLQLLHRGGLGPGTNGVNLVRISLYRACLDYMPQIFHTATTKKALLSFGEQFLTAEPLEHLSQVLHV